MLPPCHLGFNVFHFIFYVVFIHIVDLCVFLLAIIVFYVCRLSLQVVGTDSVAKISHRAKLPYMRATIKEILRIASPGITS